MRPYSVSRLPPPVMGDRDKQDNVQCETQIESYEDMMTLTCCQDHILKENIWFVWSKTSDSGDKWRCYRCGTTEQTNSEDRATKPMDAGG